MKVLITGASGFLAQHFIPAFEKAGHEVVGVDKRPPTYMPSKFIQTDIRDLGYRDMANIDAVVHLGWRTNIPDCARHPVESTYDNIDMTMHLLEISKEAGIKKFLFPSTASLYSHNPTPWTEDMPGQPIEPYSWQKLACEFACQMYAKNGMPTTIFRFFQIFGEHQREDTALSLFIRLTAEGKPVTLTKTVAQSSFKSGQRDFIYAGDVASAVVMAAQSNKIGKGEIMNVASGSVNTMEEVAKALGARIKWIPRREYEVERHEADISKLKKLGWEPKVNIIDWLGKIKKKNNKSKKKKK